MAIRCDDCRLILTKSQSTCPVCGLHVFQDALPDETWLEAGYTYAQEGSNITHEAQVEEPASQNFFQNYQSTPTQQFNSTLQSMQSTPTQQDDLYTRRIQQIEREQRRLQRQAAFDNFFYRFGTLPWGGISRFIFFIVIVILLITIWNMRYAILHFFIQLLYPVIIVIGIYWLLRSFFV